jgi:hypothetical protein
MGRQSFIFFTSPIVFCSSSIIIEHPYFIDRTFRDKGPDSIIALPFDSGEINYCKYCKLLIKKTKLIKDRLFICISNELAINWPSGQLSLYASSSPATVAIILSTMGEGLQLARPPTYRHALSDPDSALGRRSSFRPEQAASSHFEAPGWRFYEHWPRRGGRNDDQGPR